MKLLAALCLLLLAPIAARAADLTVTIKDTAGRPVADAVVMVYPAGGVGSAPIRFPWAYTISQKDVKFEPFVLIVPVGGKVDFPNLDKVRHHVYSFSAGNKFELKLYGREDKRSVDFKTAGVVAMGCNIHDRMSAFIRVVDTPFAMKTDVSGEAVIRGLPAGAAQMRIWHPYLRAPKNEVGKAVTVPAQGAGREVQTLDVRAPAAMDMAH